MISGRATLDKKPPDHIAELGVEHRRPRPRSQATLSQAVARQRRNDGAHGGLVPASDRGRMMSGGRVW
jgi:hypothetical protein